MVVLEGRMIWSCVDMTNGRAGRWAPSATLSEEHEPNLDDALTSRRPNRQAEDLALFAEVPQNVPAPSYPHEDVLMPFGGVRRLGFGVEPWSAY